MNFDELTRILDTGTRQELDSFCQEHDLVVRDGKVFHSDDKLVRDSIEYWDKRQHVKKINLNS